jgi:imidazolonepropionase-like amidohydrolase
MGRVTRGWVAHGIELPFGTTARSWWVNDAGVVGDAPIDDAEALPGRFVLSGLVDAHAHPAIRNDAHEPLALGADQASSVLVAWAESGITLVRDVGSPGGVTLSLNLGPTIPAVRAAGRFLAPADRYFPQLLVEPVDDEHLVDAAEAEVRRGASWVKVIADFPKLPEFGDVARTYPLGLLTEMCEKVHTLGARVAAHTTLPGVGDLLTAGVDSVEHGPGLDREAIAEMGRRGVAWVPTLCAALGALGDPDSPPERRQRAEETRERLAELLPAAVRCGVPILTGTDVVGSIPAEVAWLAKLGLDPSAALAAATVWGRQFIDPTGGTSDLVTYDGDPRDDPAVLAQPAAVVMRGRRVR